MPEKIFQISKIVKGWSVYLIQIFTVAVFYTLQGKLLF